MTVRDLERELRRLGLSRSQSKILISRGRCWRWLASISVELFAHFVTWRIR